MRGSVQIESCSGHIVIGIYSRQMLNLSLYGLVRFDGGPAGFH